MYPAQINRKQSVMNDKNVFSPRILRPEDANQNWSWDRPLASPGFKQVDFETRVDFQRLRKYRLSRSRNALKNSGLGALLLFDVNNIRYITGTKIGEWERDKLCRFALLAGDEEKGILDFLMAQPISRAQMFWGRLLAFFICLAVIIGFGWF